MGPSGEVVVKKACLDWGIFLGYVLGYVWGAVSRYLSRHGSQYWALDDRDVVGLCFGVCIGVCI